MIITLLRKPLEGSVAENTLKHDCGAININATRVGDQVMISTAMSSLGVMHDDDWVSKPIQPVESVGRWPANFILTHLEGCESKGTKKVKSGTAYQDNKTEKNYVYGGERGSFNPTKLNGKAGYASEDGKENVVNWVCVEGCPVKSVDQQSNGDSSRFFKQFKTEDDQ